MVTTRSGLNTSTRTTKPKRMLKTIPKIPSQIIDLYSKGMIQPSAHYFKYIIRMYGRRQFVVPNYLITWATSTTTISYMPKFWLDYIRLDDKNFLPLTFSGELEKVRVWDGKIAWRLVVYATIRDDEIDFLKVNWNNINSTHWDRLVHFQNCIQSYIRDASSPDYLLSLRHELQ